MRPEVFYFRTHFFVASPTYGNILECMGNETKIVTLDKGTYRPEELTSKEHGAFIPFKVDLMIKVAENRDPVPYTMFLRAPNPYCAMEACIMAFNSMERKRAGVPDYMEYPSVCTSDEAESFCYGLYEDQYMEFWKEAQAAKVCRHIGPKENPSWFMFMNDTEWDLPELMKPAKSNIISTGELCYADAARVAAAKAEIDRKMKK